MPIGKRDRHRLLWAILAVSDWPIAIEAGNHAHNREAHMLKAGRNGTTYQIAPEYYCSDDKKDVIITKKDMYAVSSQECEDMCSNDPECGVFEMDCGVRCILLRRCDGFLRSGCHAYVGLKVSHHRKLPPKNSHLVAMLFGAAIGVTLLWQTCGLCLRLVDEQGSAQPPLEDAGNPEEGGMSSRPLASNDGGYHRVGTIEDPQPSNAKEKKDKRTYWKIVQALLILAFLLAALSTLTFGFFPKDDRDGTPRGVCGLVHEDRRPFSLLDFVTGAQDPHLVVDGELHVVPALQVMPLTCWRILLKDVVEAETGPTCHSWCQSVVGWIPRPWCETLPGTGHLYRVCDKAMVWSLFWYIPADWGSYIITGVYILITIARGYQKAYLDESRLSPQTRESAEVVVPPKDTKWREDQEPKGPYRGYHAVPFGCIPAESDMVASKWQTRVSALPNLLDPIGDMNAGLAFLFDGQLVYSFIILGSVLGPHLNDPFQAGPFATALRSTWRGYQDKDNLLELRKQGMCEGVISVLVMVHALMRASYNGAVVSYAWVANIILMVVNSTIFTIPQAVMARDLLENFFPAAAEAEAEAEPASRDLNFDDFYAVAEKKEAIKLRKYLVSFDVLALAVAMARTFTHTSLLFMLWAIGAVSGFLGWLCYCARSGKLARGVTDFSADDLVKQIFSYFLVFACWPSAPSRLTAKGRVWRQLEHLRSKKDKEKAGFRPLDAVFYGYASMPPTVYYSHRIFTLTAFWTLTVWLDLSFYREIYKDFVNRVLEPEQLIDLGKSGWWVLPLVTCGMLSLLAEAAVFLYFREQLEEAFRQSHVAHGVSFDGKGQQASRQSQVPRQLPGKDKQAVRELQSFDVPNEGESGIRGE
eukprot:TRINITY_DN4924_c0_g1_i11.p1 TRINITY_DN4924_c0_g1~~TRINITY_DN4924_c0_g1_i11.p1  ORF type:complete len:868 (-),score=134.96 TRINITY_DN4924_c0_g1_i11:277-2880(-)